MKTIVLDIENWKKSDLTLVDYIFLQFIDELKHKEAESFTETYFDCNDIAMYAFCNALEQELWIKKSGNEYIIRQKGLDLFKKSSKFDIPKLAKEYRDLFPKGVRTGGVLVRSDLLTIEKKLSDFIAKYKYTPEQIILTTKKYVERKKADNYEYMKTAGYFIQKQNVGSALAAEIDNTSQQDTKVIEFDKEA